MRFAAFHQRRGWPGRLGDSLGQYPPARPAQTEAANLVPIRGALDRRFGGIARAISRLGACPNSRCSILSESDSTVGYEQVFSPLEYRSDAASAAQCAGLPAERPCLRVYR